VDGCVGSEEKGADGGAVGGGDGVALAVLDGDGGLRKKRRPSQQARWRTRDAQGIRGAGGDFEPGRDGGPQGCGGEGGCVPGPCNRNPQVRQLRHAAHRPRCGTIALRRRGVTGGVVRCGAAREDHRRAGQARDRGAAPAVK
jgi:hypothetical protein